MTTTTPAASNRSVVQRTEALAKANSIRLRRAEMKRELRAHRQPVAPLLIAPPDYLTAMKVHAFLMTVPMVGRARANRWLKQAGISPTKTIGGLSDRQRRELLRIMQTNGGMRR
jgi:S13-like H2TH domain